jgi:hypothetical protein
MTAGARNDNPVRKVRLMGQSTQRCRLQHQLSNREVDTDTLRAHTAVRFPALQFNAVKKQFMVTRKVPIPDDGFPELPARYLTLRGSWPTVRATVQWVRICAVNEEIKKIF